MNCSNYCHQGRQPCATPWTCGKYEFDATPHRIQFYGPEPEEAPEPKQWPFWLIAVGAVLALLFVLLDPSAYWPRFVSFMGAV